MRVLITGCARSGTLYIAKVLEALGLDVSREQLGAEHVVSWRDVGGQFDVVLQQVREPLATIGSCQTIRKESWDHACAYVPIDRQAPLLARCAEFWYYWNLRCRGMAHWVYRIEDLPKVWNTFRVWVGASKATYAQAAHIPRMMNHRKHSEVTWGDIEKATPLCDEIRRLAESYGYR